MRRLAVLLLALPSRALAGAGPAAAGPIPPLRPPRGEIPPGFWEQHGVWVLVLGVGLAVLVCGGLWLLLRPRVPAPPPPANARARRALESMRGAKEDGAVLSRASRVLRSYVAEVFGLPPAEMTTTEFCEAVGRCDRAGVELSEAVGGFLRECDRRKFAPAHPEVPFNGVAQALSLVDRTEARMAALRASEEAALAKEAR